MCYCMLFFPRIRLLMFCIRFAGHFAGVFRSCTIFPPDTALSIFARLSLWSFARSIHVFRCVVFCISWFSDICACLSVVLVSKFFSSSANSAAFFAASSNSFLLSLLSPISNSFWTLFTVHPDPTSIFCCSISFAMCSNYLHKDCSSFLSIATFFL